MSSCAVLRSIGRRTDFYAQKEEGARLGSPGRTFLSFKNAFDTFVLIQFLSFNLHFAI